MKTGGSKKARCAIYTRVSTDQGLEQDFNSLDAQYDASQAYIRSQQHAGWTMADSGLSATSRSARRIGSRLAGVCLTGSGRGLRTGSAGSWLTSTGPKPS